MALIRCHTRICCPSLSLTLFVCFQSQTASENVSSLWNPWVQLFACENAALIVKLNQFFTSSPPDVLNKLPPELAGEWTDFFVEGIYNLMFALPVNITGVCGFYFRKVMTISWKQAYSEKSSTKINKNACFSFSISYGRC